MTSFHPIEYCHEPTPLQCGQAVLAMLTGLDIAQIVSLCKTDRETTLADMKRVLTACGIRYGETRIAVDKKEELPDVCLLSLETPRCWHWSLYANGTFYDPEHGISDDFPQCNRKYYWKIYAQE